MRRILVTGGAGFIGRRTVLALAKQGHEVYVYDSMQLGSTNEFKPLTTKIHTIRGDMRDYSGLEKVVKRADQVLHLAAPSSFLMYEERPIDAATITYVGFLNLIEAVRRSNKNRLVFASTSAVYEGLPTPWREDMNCFPPDLKALSKLQNEQIAKQYGDRYGLKTVALRPLSVYGVGEYTKKGYANVISLFVWAMINGERPIVWGDGTQTRDFVYVDDCADTTIRILEYNWNEQSSNFEIFNVGTGRATSFNDVVRLINGQLGTDLSPTYVEVPLKIYAKEICGDTTKVRQLLGWEAKITVKDGIGKIIENARKEPKVMKLFDSQEYALHIGRRGK